MTAAVSTLGSVCEAIVDCEHKTAPTQLTGIPLIRTTDIQDGRLDVEGAKRISDVTYELWSRRLQPRACDIILAREAPVGEVGWVPPGSTVCLGQRTVLLRADSTRIEPRYLLYLLMSKPLRQRMLSRAEGSTNPHLNVPEIRNLLLPPRPSIEEQREIASVLGALDDKIEVNRRMSKTLEALARAIFQSWFVDFDPVRAKAEGRRPGGMDAETAALFPSSFADSPLGPIPIGWRIGRVGDVADFSRLALDPGDCPAEQFDHYSIPAFDNNRAPRVEIGASIKSSKFLVVEGSVLVSKLNPRIPRVWLPHPEGRQRAIASTEFLVAIPTDGRWREWIHGLFVSTRFADVLASLATGTSGSHQRARPNDVLVTPIVVPVAPVRDAFRSVVKPLLDLVAVNEAATSVLVELRDALLPKLISGEVRVGSA